MAFVFSMPVAVVEVIQVSFMLDRLMGAVRAAVFMFCQAVLGVDFLSHFGHFRLLQGWSGGAVRRLLPGWGKEWNKQWPSPDCPPLTIRH
jgi:hypothetical protein